MPAPSDHTTPEDHKGAGLPLRQINSLQRLSLQLLPIPILTTQAQRGMRVTVFAIGPISHLKPA